MNWETSGIAYAELLDRLIQLALARYQQQRGYALQLQEMVPDVLGSDQTSRPSESA